MAWSRSVWTACALGLSLLARSGRAQTLAVSAPAATEDALHAMEELAGVIFSGQVVAVRRVTPKGSMMNSSAGIVEVEFAIEDAVRGVSGSSYTMREWAGLWPAGDTPFRVGQRYLMLLHSPAGGGLSSPVGGTDGAIPIRADASGAGAVVASAGGARAAVTPKNAGAGMGGPLALGGDAQNVNASGVSSGGAPAQVVDLGWVGTRVVRPVVYAATPTRAVVRPLAANTNVSGGSMASVEGTAATPVQGMDYAAALAMLRRWDGDSHGPR